MGKKIALSVLENYELAKEISGDKIAYGQKNILVKFNKGKPEEMEEAILVNEIYQEGGNMWKYTNEDRYDAAYAGSAIDLDSEGKQIPREVLREMDKEKTGALIRAAALMGCALAGADIATVPYKTIEQCLKHPLTDAGIEKFKKDYLAVFGE